MYNPSTYISRTTNQEGRMTDTENDPRSIRQLLKYIAENGTDEEVEVKFKEMVTERVQEVADACYKAAFGQGEAQISTLTAKLKAAEEALEKIANYTTSTPTGVLPKGNWMQSVAKAALRAIRSGK